MEYFVPNAVDAGGNITSWVLGADAYEYDALNRVTAVSETATGGTGTGFTQKFLYDRWGNRTIDVANTTNLPGITRDSFTVNTTNNRLTAKNGVAFGYDNAGNQTTFSTVGQTDYELRDYEAENRMTKAIKSGQTNYYFYDASGKRVRRIVNGTQSTTANETWQVYGFDGELVAEYAYNGAVSSPVKEYGYRGGQMLVVFDSTETGDNQLKWLVTDHLGSTRMLVNRSGSLAGVKRRDYLPFGEELAATVGHRAASGSGYQVTDKPRQKFTGHERDTETGLDFMQARYCSSVQGRFISPDEVFADQSEDEPQSWNLYTYVANNPLKYSDPFELWKKFVDGSNIYYIAEKGDTLTSLAGEIGTSPDRVVNFFDGNDKVPIGVYYNVTALVAQLEREHKQIQNLMQYLERRSGDLIERRIQGDSVDPLSPWKMHWPGIGCDFAVMYPIRGNLSAQASEPR